MRERVRKREKKRGERLIEIDRQIDREREREHVCEREMFYLSYLFLFSTTTNMYTQKVLIPLEVSMYYPQLDNASSCLSIFIR